MERYLSLNGDWKLYYYEEETQAITTPAELEASGLEPILASVPGNVELDLSRAGILPTDLFMGENIVAAEQYETYAWWYQTEFDAPEFAAGETVWLHLEGVDCIAAYFLNGEKIGASDNAMVPVHIDITNTLKRGKNVLFVHIASAMNAAYQETYQMHSLYNSWHSNYETLNLRKPAHAFGWDIMPRAVSAGLWKDVRLAVKTACNFSQLAYQVTALREGGADLRFAYELDMPPAFAKQGLTVEINGVCGAASFSASKPVRFKAGYVDISVENPLLWWPYGYGAANIYDTTVTIVKDGEILAQKTLNVGIRTVKLLRSDSLADKNAQFQFQINGVDVFCRGSNWVPLDAYHSRDAARYEKALALVRDIGCNILRCWGGNVYEQEPFYDFCDRNGVLVWQDFSMACYVYPITDAFCKKMEEEATQIVKALRTHPSILLWSGDNECDEALYLHGTNPAKNKLTRQVLPDVVTKHDPFRPYLASSPYICPDVHETQTRCNLPEEHLWGPRDYFKSKFYTNSKAKFVSETGYHGCPSRKSIEKFIDSEFVWPYERNPQWNLHSSDQHNRDERVMLMANQIRQLFGAVPDNLDDFALASQISQAEAKKFFIERMRIQKPYTSGIIWWNLLDGWPQMSDAVVDYYFEKKLAYDYIKHSQAPFCIMLDEMVDWGHAIVAVNDTLERKEGRFQIVDIETEEMLEQGAFTLAPNGVKTLGKLHLFYSEQRMLLISWETEQGRGVNHYLCGMPAFDFARYQKWLERLKQYYK